MATHVIRNDVACLHRHIVQRRGHRPRPHRPGIPRCHRHNGRVHVWTPDQKNEDRPSRPRAGIRRQHLQRDQQHEVPHLRHRAQQQPLVDAFRHPRPEREIDDEDDVCRDGQQVRLERVEPQRRQLQRDVVGRRAGRDHPRQTQQVDQPHVVVTQRLPEQLGRHRLAVVHGALAGVVPDDPVHHDLLFPFAEPSVFPPEAASRLSGRRRHVERRKNTDHAGDETLKGKEIPPSFLAVVNVQEAKGKERADNGGGFVGDPETAQTDRKLFRFVPVGKEKDGVGDAKSY